MSWFDWKLLKKNQEMFCFTKGMIQLRKRHPCLMQRQFLSGTMNELSRLPDIAWHGLQLNEPQWADTSARVLACTLSRVGPEEEDLHIMFNMSEDTLFMELPKLKERIWHLAVDTECSTSRDIIEPKHQQAIKENTIQVCSHSIVVCESR